jgi:hypothetical protein
MFILNRQVVPGSVEVAPDWVTITYGEELVTVHYWGLAWELLRKLPAQLWAALA